MKNLEFQRLILKIDEMAAKNGWPAFSVASVSTIMKMLCDLGTGFCVKREKVVKWFVCVHHGKWYHKPRKCSGYSEGRVCILVLTNHVYAGSIHHTQLFHWCIGNEIPIAFTTWWTLGTMISTSVFYKLSEESYIRHGKLDSSIMLTLFSIVLICYVVVGDSGFH